jgi:hypothetical protein
MEQADLARDAGTSLNTVQRIERMRLVRDDIAARVADLRDRVLAAPGS